MPKQKEDPAPPPTVFHANLRAAIGTTSVNEWVKDENDASKALEQSTIQRIYNGADPRLSTILRIAHKLGVEPWELLSTQFNLTNRPIIKGAAGAPEEAFWRRMEELIRENEELRRRANTAPAPLGDD